MSGHSKWASIKRRKAVADQKRGQVFSKILGSISTTARKNADPRFNSKLRSLIEQAKKNKVPEGNINRAIKSVFNNKETKRLIIEAYGPGGVAIIINARAANSNRVLAEIRHILTGYQSKIAEAGSVRWAFIGDQSRFFQEVSRQDRAQAEKLIENLEKHPDVQKVITNLK